MNERRGLLKSFRAVSLATLLSRLLGLVRDVGMAIRFGNGPVLDAFSVAFRIPNIARRLFGEGAMSTAMLPPFVASLKQSGKPAAFALARRLLWGLFCVLVAIVVAAEILLAMGYSAAPAGNGELLLSLLAILVPYLLLICLTAQFCGVLHGLDRFGIPALVPVVLNIVWIAALFVVPLDLTPRSQVAWIAAAVVIAGVLQFALAAWAARREGFSLRGEMASAKTAEPVWRSLWPILGGLSLLQAGTLVDSLIAWGFAQPGFVQALPEFLQFPLPEGTAAALYQGQRLYQFPLGVFGVALGTVMFAKLTQHAAEDDQKALREDINFGLRLTLAIGIPASVGLGVLALPITELIFQHGAFDAEDARQTAAMMVAYGAAVWSACGLLVLTRSFYAIGDQRTPLRLGGSFLAINLVLDLPFLALFGGPGLGWAFATASACQWILGARAARRRFGGGNDPRIGRCLAKSLAGSLLMGLACFSIVRALPEPAGMFDRLIRVGIPLAAGFAIYAAFARLTKLSEFAAVLSRSKTSDPPEEP